MPWQRRYFSNQNTDKPVKVWVQVNKDDNLLISDNRAQIRYEDSSEAKIYSVDPSNLSQEKSATTDNDTSLIFQQDQYRKTRKISTTVPDELKDSVPPEDSITIYTDGSASKGSGEKEGPAGIGIVLRSSDYFKEIHQYIGNATNQVAELAAIYVGLDSLNSVSKPIQLYTDSQYSRGMIVNENWEAKANQKLVKKLRKLARTFDDLKIKWVEGHSGNAFNERADQLAKTAVKDHRNR